MKKDFKDNPKITRKVMQQYEMVRRSGRCNMFDLPAVYATARLLGHHALERILFHDLKSELTDLYARSDYVHILTHFGYYMRKYNIHQPDRQGKEPKRANQRMHPKDKP